MQEFAALKTEVVMDVREDTFGHYERSAAGNGSLFRDRVDAGQQLAKALISYRGTNPLVLGIPRGGVPMAYQVAQQKDAEAASSTASDAEAYALMAKAGDRKLKALRRFSR